MNPEYVEYVVDGRGERSREREEESSAVASLRVELAEALGRLTRAESELAAVAARCDALERVCEEDGDEDPDARAGAPREMVVARVTSPRDVSTPSRESTEDFIARYVEKLRAASKHDEDEDDEDAYVRGAPRECARA